MKQKLQTAVWFAQRPTMWAHAASMAVGRFQSDRDGPEQARAAASWAADRAVSVEDALRAVGVDVAAGVPVPPQDVLAEGSERARQSAVRMGGPGDVNLLYAAIVASGARRVIETGVAYGWSSLAILSALEARDGAKLVSVDMPYPKMNNEAFVGIVVPDRLRSKWEIVREPDRFGLKKAIRLAGGQIDLCHYDSDKTWKGRQYGYNLLWDALAAGGLFISDDIQDNMAFAEFMDDKRVRFAATAFENKFVGIAKKV